MDSVSTNKSEQMEKQSRVIVSLTTYPARIDRVHKTIDTLIRQTVKADMIVLWLAKEQFPDGESSLPAQLLAQKEHGLRIEWCSDLKSYKKIIPAAEKWPEDIIITADDDIVYEINAIERLLESYRKHPNCVSTLRTHLIMFGDDGMPLPYDQWKAEYSGLIDQPLMALFPTTGAGTLFPPGVLPEEAFDSESFMKLCPMADDVWVKMMLTLAGVPVVLADTNTRLQYVDGTQQETLYAHNRIENDAQLRAILEVFNDVGGDEVPDDTLVIRMNDLSDYTPDDSLCQNKRKNRSFVNEDTGVKVSVILTGHNSCRNFVRCLRSAMSQTLSQIEIICVDNGSTDNTSELLRNEACNDSRVNIIRNIDKCCTTQARRKAVLASKGEYCLFPEISGVLAPDACEKLYAKAEENDADIFAFTRGVIDGRLPNAAPEFTGHVGRLRNVNIALKEFGAGCNPEGKLSSCIFSGRLSRKAYLHADENPCNSDLYEYYLLCKAAEVYEGQQTQIYFAATRSAPSWPVEQASNVNAIESYARFAGISDTTAECTKNIRRQMVWESINKWITKPVKERETYITELVEVWGETEIAAAIILSAEENGESVLRELHAHCQHKVRKREIKNVGVAVGSQDSAVELFIMTELLDCIGNGCNTTFIGIDRSAASNAVKATKTVYAGEELNESEATDAYVFAQRFADVVCDHEPDAVVVWAGSEKFVRITVQSALNGIPVVAVVTEPVYNPMLSCSRPYAGLSALRLATVVVTDSAEQCSLLKAAGIHARYIPRPSIRLMGGRTNARTSDNVIAWIGRDDAASRIGDALDIFNRVSEVMPDVKMQMYLDGNPEVGNYTDIIPDGVTIRRLRPDYGVFSDAAVQLITAAAGVSSDALRAGRTLGVPAVMYRPEGRNDTGAGAIIIQPGDRASAAEEIIRLLKDKELRDQLGSQAKKATGAGDSAEVSAGWCSVLRDLINDANLPARIPEDELGSALCAAMTGYEDGAMYNYGRLEEYRMRCDDYERQIDEAEQRRLNENEAHEKVIENLRAQLRDKERVRAHTAAQLEDIRTSTSYKAGSLLTFIPRWIKMTIQRYLKNKE